MERKRFWDDRKRGRKDEREEENKERKDRKERNIRKIKYSFQSCKYELENLTKVNIY